MLLAVLLIAVLLIVAAIRNSQKALFTALGQDVPGFIVWAAAIVAVGAVGYIPGLKGASRGLLALVLLVIILRNYSAVVAGFQASAQAGAGGSGSTAQVGGGTASSAAPSAATVASVSSSILPNLLPDNGSSFAPTLSSGASISQVAQSFTPSLEGAQ
jgi:hypothetical protein